MTNKIFDFKLCNKNDEFIEVDGINIPIPHFIKRSIKKYRLKIIDDNIFLQRKCILCNDFFNVQVLEDGEFKNLEDSKVRYIGVKSGFHTKCITCEDINLNTNNITLNSNTITDNETTVQLNIVVSPDLKRFFKLLSINNNTSLKYELQMALNFYKDFITKNN